MGVVRLVRQVRGRNDVKEEFGSMRSWSIGVCRRSHRMGWRATKVEGGGDGGGREDGGRSVDGGRRRESVNGRDWGGYSKSIGKLCESMGREGCAWGCPGGRYG